MTHGMASCDIRGGHAWDITWHHVTQGFSPSFLFFLGGGGDFSMRTRVGKIRILITLHHDGGTSAINFLEKALGRLHGEGWRVKSSLVKAPASQHLCSCAMSPNAS